MENLSPRSEQYSSPGFLCLPTELRLQIYYYIIPRERVIPVTSPQFNKSPSAKWLHHTSEPDESCDQPGFSYDSKPELSCKPDYPTHCTTNVFLMSKQTSNEALDILYGDNVFRLEIDRDDYYFRTNFTEPNRRRMRFLVISMGPVRLSYRDKRPDGNLWSPVLPSVKRFRIVAKPPDHYTYSRSPEQDMNDWLNYRTPYLQCFGSLLSGNATVEVDVDGRKDAFELVKEHITNFQEVRCRLVGDHLFRRGRYSNGLGVFNPFIPSIICCRAQPFLNE
ncbi:hypothetical protein CC78DRAFT_361330 [Lojkania enalia]|uniref:DUF7730 domain-containing protein n=1 Tax=Lojkania enalia TaxID=147567 RepID=A0A9P4K6Y2_9PLEO|nr:hypothetical protein CC78DRAFT_361330 [Didymosphaeria enalia]